MWRTKQNELKKQDTNTMIRINSVRVRTKGNKRRTIVLIARKKDTLQAAAPICGTRSKVRFYLHSSWSLSTNLTRKKWFWGRSCFVMTPNSNPPAVFPSRYPINIDQSTLAIFGTCIIELLRNSLWNKISSVELEP